MFELVKFEQKHAEFLLNLPENEQARSFFKPNDFAAMCANPAVTGLNNGVPVICGGVLRMWQGHGYVWTLFNSAAKQSFVPIFRAIKSVLKDSMLEFNRLSIAIPINFPQAVRRAKMLGFEIECERAKKYFPTGEDAVLMAYFGETNG